MAATTAAIREALRVALADPTNGLADEWLQISAYMLAQPQCPAIDVRPGGVEYDAAMGRSLDSMTFLIRAMVAFNIDQGAQIMLDNALDVTDSNGVKTVLEHDRTLGAVVSDLRVTEASDYKALIVEGQPPMLAVEFTVEVYP